jgi:hypothetical protein
MNNKFCVKIFVTFIAASVAAIHLIFPGLKIDYVTGAFVILALIPWMEPLFKSINLPGGAGIQYRDLQKTETLVEESGLIYRPIEEDLESGHTISNTEFTAVAANNLDLTIPAFQIELDKNLRQLADKNGITASGKSILTLVDGLEEKKIINGYEAGAIKSLIISLNKYAMAGNNMEKFTEWVINKGPGIINGLKRKINNINIK